MNGTTPEDIINLTVNECSADIAGCGVTNRRVLSASSSQLASTYTVTVDTTSVPGATYISLSSQLSDAVSSGGDINIKIHLSRTLIVVEFLL